VGTTYGPINLTFTDRSQWVLHNVLEKRASTHSDRPFLQWELAAPLTFAEVNREVNRLGHGLRSVGVKHGDPVAILLPNCLEYILVWFALSKLGAIEVPINPMYRGEFLEHALNVSGARIAITDAEFLSSLHAVEHQCPGLETLFLRHSSQSAPTFERMQIRDFAELRSSDSSNLKVEVGYRDVAAIIFTSGTTGPSKGVVIHHSQLYFFAQQCVDLVQLTEDDAYMNPFPLFHGNAQFLTVYPCLIAGARAIILERFSASAWADRARACGATVANLLAETMGFILAQPPRAEDCTNHLRLIYAVPTTRALIDEWRRRFGHHIFVNAFGQTETGWPLMVPHGEEFPEGAVGKHVDEWFDVRLVDPDTDEEVPVGQVGELVVRPKVPWTACAGYNMDHESTRRVQRNLWWHTGDGLRRDEQGWFYFVDRVNDALRVRGENVSSYEVERTVLQHPAVAECCAVSVRSGIAGGEHEIKVCIVLKEDAKLDPAELVRFCDARAPSFAVPRYVEIVDELPRTPNEKVRKILLREIGVNRATWDRVAAGVVLLNRLSKAADRS
jgi:carnitine-CoA ligase